MKFLEMKTEFELSETSSPIKHLSWACGGGQIYDVLFHVRNLRIACFITNPTVVRACVVTSRSL